MSVPQGHTWIVQNSNKQIPAQIIHTEFCRVPDLILYEQAHNSSLMCFLSMKKI